MKDQEFNVGSPYLIYLYAFLILFAFGIGIGFFRNNFKNSIKDKNVEDKPLISVDKNEQVFEKVIIKDNKKDSSGELKSITKKITANNTLQIKEVTQASPSLEEIRNLINAWLQSKSNYLAGKNQLNLSKIVNSGLIDRTKEERQKDINKGIYKEINSQILKIDLETRTSSRISVLVELNYLEKIIKNSGEFINETSLNPLKVKYIFGFSDKSWKLVDFVSGV